MMTAPTCVDASLLSFDTASAIPMYLDNLEVTAFFPFNSSHVFSDVVQYVWAAGANRHRQERAFRAAHLEMFALANDSPSSTYKFSDVFPETFVFVLEDGHHMSSWSRQPSITGCRGAVFTPTGKYLNLASFPR